LFSSSSSSFVVVIRRRHSSSFVVVVAVARRSLKIKRNQHATSTQPANQSLVLSDFAAAKVAA
jgi:hypothetical protein